MFWFKDYTTKRPTSDENITLGEVSKPKTSSASRLPSYVLSSNEHNNNNNSAAKNTWKNDNTNSSYSQTITKDSATKVAVFQKLDTTKINFFQQCANINTSSEAPLVKLMKKAALVNQENLTAIVKTLKNFKAERDPKLALSIFAFLVEVVAFDEKFEKILVYFPDLIYYSVEYVAPAALVLDDSVKAAFAFLARVSEKFAKELEVFSLSQINQTIKNHFRKYSTSPDAGLKSATLCLATNVRLFQKHSSSTQDQVLQMDSARRGTSDGASIVEAQAKLTIVFELFGPLVSYQHCNVANVEKVLELSQGAKYAFKVDKSYYALTKRPKLDEFLAWCASKFNMVVFSSKEEAVVREALRYVDPDRSLFSRRVFTKADCVVRGGVLLKDLALLELNRKRLINIDHQIMRCALDPDNYLPVAKYDRADKNDSALGGLKNFLQRLEGESDVTKILIPTFSIRRFLEEEAAEKAQKMEVEKETEKMEIVP